ncbi:MAG: flagellar type III secretion system pore protein FliP [Acidobacteriia bacterium]|nr:flagellar type III secretion system pore protein FliP [Terriglobia bacterium]
MSDSTTIRIGISALALVFLAATLVPAPAVAAAAPLPGPSPQIRSIPIPGLNNRNDSLPWTVLILFTILTLLPALLLSMTPFVRILIVFHFLRQALGTQTAPTNQTLLGLALFLTYFVMQPVGMSINKVSIEPFAQGSITAWQAVERSADPMRQFMLKYTREKDLALFVEMSHEPRPRRPNDLSMRVVVPAYIISELKTGFQIGAVLFLPFLVIDMVVAAITTSIGMFQLPPVVISTPLKILLFVVADGWNLVVGSTLKSFY